MAAPLTKPKKSTSTKTKPKKPVAGKTASGVNRAGKAKLISSKIAYKGKVFNVFTDTTLTDPFANWTWLGEATETSPGQFQFTDPPATNGAAAFYRVVSP